jgi:hypothetical protein
MAGRFDRTESWFEDGPWYNNPLAARSVDSNDSWSSRALGHMRNGLVFVPNLISKIAPITLDVVGNVARTIYKPITAGIRMISRQVGSTFDAISKVLIDHPTQAIQEVATSTQQAISNILKSPFKRFGEAFKGQ